MDYRYLLIFTSALLLAAGSTPLVRRVALRLGFIDHPTARKLHTDPIPLLGGAAIYGSFVLALIAFGDRFYVNQVVGIFLGATLVSFMGLWDDSYTLSPYLKLIGQLLAAAILVVSDVKVNFLPWETLNIMASLLWIVGITNAFNLLDNMDGLSSGVAAIAGVFFLMLAALNGQYLVGALAAALLGACIGFWVYNFNPARIFMGDSGSLFLGFMLAAVAIKLRFPNNIDHVTWMVPVLVLLLPIFDTLLVSFSRLRRGVNPLTHPGKDHLSHRFVEWGYTRREAVLVCYLIGGAGGVMGIFMSLAGVLEAYVAAAVLVAFGVWAIWQLEWRRGAKPV